MRRFSGPIPRFSPDCDVAFALALFLSLSFVPRCQAETVGGTVPPGEADAPGTAVRPAIVDLSGSAEPFEGISSRARCTGPNGSSFTTEIVSLADGTVRFDQIHPSGRAEILVAGGSVFTGSSGTEGEQQARAPQGEQAPQAVASDSLLGRAPRLEPAPAVLEAFVRGHEIHRMLLELEDRFRVANPDSAGLGADGCIRLEDRDGNPAELCLAGASGLPVRLDLSIPQEIGGGTVRIEFEDWRDVHGAQLPYRARFLHAGEVHTYEFYEVLPFRLWPSTVLPTDPERLFQRLRDVADVLAVHERALAAHRGPDLDLLLADEAEEGFQSSRGSLSVTTREQLAMRLGPYLEATRFVVYEDEVVPVVAVSADGTLAWLGCEVGASGEQRGPAGESVPVEFGSSWIELLTRDGGQWRRVGNASSTRP